MTFYVVTTRGAWITSETDEPSLLAHARRMGWNLLRWVRVR